MSRPISRRARVFCATLDPSLQTEPVEPPLETAVSRAFLDLFRRAGLNRQTNIVAQIKARAGQLPLPTAAQALKSFKL